ncbi:probable sucrose-phosphate synthase 3 [Selaginella moellendorffii]|uniref:probable sucrose-phosphate synthase 3 n=1 Tax=Selaginella moellendorffii TaxID=88036 RepID=UPI000D1CBA87|nr:probable sucrose-phosphate synthase 3 [Selaginella moellendorffii]|eukprot:XP_024536141.1 probable sucrose-phosphate synthase 3 [Selaginella moellendorffii]
MEGNEWIDGYLNAFLEIGSDVHRNCAPSSRSSPKNRVGAEETRQVWRVSRYFVEEVVSKFEERDIHQSWAKATVRRNDKIQSVRLENLCWRIWFERRKWKRIESERAQGRAARERGQRDAEEELLEDLSDGEKLELAEANSSSSSGSGTKKKSMLRNLSVLHSWSDQERGRNMYIVLISLHGLVRGENMELGRDSDTGGQVKYVVELAKSLAAMPGVYRVDLLTRQICATDEVDWSYCEPTEMLCCTGGESSGAYIVRIPCGPREQYLRKELLWPHIEEFVDGALAHIKDMAKVLADQLHHHLYHGNTNGTTPPAASRELVWPQVVHGHYADAGYAAALISGALNVPMVMTGHSLGRNKLEQLLVQGRQSREDVNSTYKIFRRIEAEETCLDVAELVITSTKQEVVEQWGDYYFGYDVKVDRVLKIRAKKGLNCHGRFMPRMVVIPPGMDFSNVVLDSETAAIANEIHGNTVSLPTSPKMDPPIWGDIMRFLHNPHKPMILALARPDPKKNITTLLKAYGECMLLRDLANLTLIMGNRDDIDDMSAANASVLTTVLKLIDKYDLHGQVSYPKHHKQYEVPAIYQLAAKTKGVFINPALVEPFGLTLIEAAAHGLPMVATSNGGPVDIQQALHNGLLVDPHDDKAIAEALLKLLADRGLWLECQRNGLKNINVYSWPEHCRTYLSRIVSCRTRHPEWSTEDSYSNEVELDSSLHDSQEISLRLSVDGERFQSYGSVTNGKSSITVEDIKRFVEKYAQSHKKNASDVPEEAKSSELGTITTAAAAATTRWPLLRRRKNLLVLAVDNLRSHELVRDVVIAGRSYGGKSETGLVISTSLTASEVQLGLKAVGVSVLEFDALVCSSGAELYYPVASGSSSERDEQKGDPSSLPLLSKDLDYEKHVEFRWNIEGMEKTLARLFELQNGRASGIVKEAKRSNSRCLAYQTASRNSYHGMKIEELHEKLRMRGLRCHIVSCQNGTRLHVLPLFASRWSALRYLYIRWGVEIPNMFVCVGKSGDSDQEMLSRGSHKTIVWRSKRSQEEDLPSGVDAASNSEELLAAMALFVHR